MVVSNPDDGGKIIFPEQPEPKKEHVPSPNVRKEIVELMGWDKQKPIEVRRRKITSGSAERIRRAEDKRQRKAAARRKLVQAGLLKSVLKEGDNG